MANEFNLTDENVVNYDEKLHPETGAISDEELNCVSGGKAECIWICKACSGGERSHNIGEARCGIRQYTCTYCKSFKNGRCSIGA